MQNNHSYLCNGVYVPVEFHLALLGQSFFVFFINIIIRFTGELTLYILTPPEN